MNVALRTVMTLEQFLAWENRQELRFEFDGVQPVAITGGTAAHAAIQRNLIYALTGPLRGKACQVYGSELKIEVDGRIRYPDAFVVCSPVALQSKVVSDPVVVFEILSGSTAHTDLVAKNAEYRATPSIQRYVILQQRRAGATVFSRKDEDWVTEIVTADGVLRMPEIGINLSLEDIYGDLGLPIDDDDA